jgi:hypothetical protein
MLIGRSAGFSLFRFLFLATLDYVMSWVIYLIIGSRFALSHKQSDSALPIQGKVEQTGVNSARPRQSSEGAISRQELHPVNLSSKLLYAL